MIVMVCGLPGSGKTYFAERLSASLGAAHLSSDRIRRELFPVQRVYSEEEKAMVYQAMLERMLVFCHAGKHVVLDATFYKNSLRQVFIEKAKVLGEKLQLITLVADEDLSRARTSAQRVDSEANYEVYLNLKQLFEPITQQHLALQSSNDNIEQLLLQAKTYLS